MHLRKALSTATVLALSCLTAAGTATAATAAEQQPSRQAHGLGLNLSTVEAHAAALTAPVDHGALAPLTRTGAVPGSYDLTKYTLRPGDQGQVGSCAAWATGYSGYGLLMREQGISGAPMAPMYVYAQVSRGHDNGSSGSQLLPMMQKQGIDTKADYRQGDFDFTTQPTPAERANAAHYKLSGYATLPAGGSRAKAAIEDAISRGMPVPIGFQVHRSFMNLDGTRASNYSYLPGDSRHDPVVGGHEVTIVAYTALGVKIENSWGSGWGASGFFTVPWSFFDTGDVMEAHSMGKLVKS